MPKAYDSHENPPSRIHTIASAKPHLCEVAYHRGKVYPDECRECDSVCKYGLKLLELLGMDYIPADKELTVKQLSVQGQALPTLHARMKKRNV